MARKESDREDLMQEATALVRRAEWRVPFQTDRVVAGFKRDGNWSVYFGGDPVYQFDEQGRLRRAFAQGVLWRTQGTTLSRLQRHHEGNESALLRSDLDSAQLKTFLADVRERLILILHALEHCQAQRVRQIPENHDVSAEIVHALQLALQTEVHLAPAIPGKL